MLRADDKLVTSSYSKGCEASELLLAKSDLNELDLQPCHTMTR